MLALAAAQAAMTHARKALSKYKEANKRPAFASDMEQTMWKMKHQSINGAEGRVDQLRRAEGYEAIEWDMAQVVAYGKAAAKMGAGNCMEFAAVACVKLNTLKNVPNYYAVELGPPADHVFVVIGQDPGDNGRFPMDFADWDATAAVCDPWAHIACLAQQYPAEWKQTLGIWDANGMQLPIKVTTGLYFGGAAKWVSPSDPAWVDAPETSEKLNKAGPGTGKEDNGCCYITTATCRTLGLPDDCAELTALRQFRDEVLLLSEAGARDVCEYYAVAPQIVAAIDARPDAGAIYASIYRQCIRPAVEAVNAGNYPNAHAIFRRLIAATRGHFLSGR